MNHPMTSLFRGRSCLVALLVAGLMLTGGCAKGKVLVPVTGTVRVGGKPAKGAIVLLHPTFPDGATASGVADDEGVYTLVSSQAEGVEAGKYKVTITWPDPDKVKDPLTSMTPVEDAPDLLKGKYASLKTTTLEAEIESDTSELKPFEL